MGLDKTAWGKMSVLTVGSFHNFIKNDFDTRVAGQRRNFPQSLDFDFLCLNNSFFFGRQICEALRFLEYRI